MSGHTPGPWSVHLHVAGRYAADIHHDWTSEKGSNHTRTIAVVLKYAPEPEAKANAHLIAAAPKMLDAIELAATYIEDGAPASALRVLNEAAAKARGEA